MTIGQAGHKAEEMKQGSRKQDNVLDKPSNSTVTKSEAHIKFDTIVMQRKCWLRQRRQPLWMRRTRFQVKPVREAAPAEAGQKRARLLAFQIQLQERLCKEIKFGQSQQNRHVDKGKKLRFLKNRKSRVKNQFCFSFSSDSSCYG